MLITASISRWNGTGVTLPAKIQTITHSDASLSLHTNVEQFISFLTWNFASWNINCQTASYLQSNSNSSHIGSLTKHTAALPWRLLHHRRRPRLPVTSAPKMDDALHLALSFPTHQDTSQLDSTAQIHTGEDWFKAEFRCCRIFFVTQTKGAGPVVKLEKEVAACREENGVVETSVMVRTKGTMTNWCTEQICGNVGNFNILGTALTILNLRIQKLGADKLLCHGMYVMYST
jgi:hypothetical protein